MIKKIIILVFIFCITMTSNVRGGEILSLNDFDFSEGLETLRNAGYNDVDYDYVMELLSNGKILEVIKIFGNNLYNKTIGNVVLIEKTLGNLLLIVLISAFFTNFANVFSHDSVSDTGFYICYLVVITFMLTMFENFCVTASDFLMVLLEFVGGMIPAYFLSVAVIGQASAVGFYQLLLVVIAVVEFIFLKVTIPLIKIYMAISLVNNVSQEDFLSKTASTISNFVKFINKTLVGLVTGINIIQGLILPTVDNAKNTTIRKFMGSIPVIGDGSDAMTGIVLGSVNLIKNTIGTFAIILIVCLCFVPFIKMQLYSASWQVVTALMQPVADKRIINSFECMCKGTRLLGKVISSASLLFIISIAIICMVTNVRG